MFKREEIINKYILWFVKQYKYSMTPSSTQVAPWRSQRLSRTGLVLQQTSTTHHLQKPQNRRDTSWSVTSVRTRWTVFTACVLWTLTPRPTPSKLRRSVSRRQKRGKTDVSGCMTPAAHALLPLCRLGGWNTGSGGNNNPENFSQSPIH